MKRKNACYLKLLQDICIYLEARESTEDFEHFKSIKLFDDILVSLVQEKDMERCRFLPCPTCTPQGKDRYFFDVGPGFEPLDPMEFCQSLNYEDFDDDDDDCEDEKHGIDEKQKSLIRRNDLKVVTLHEFLKDGIQKIEKRPFRELEGNLKVGDQIWIYRDRRSNPCNPVAVLMPYAHVAVYVGEEDGQKKVVHVTKSSIMNGIMTATIKKVSVNNVINPLDRGIGFYIKEQFSN